jgi:hypothetical protein
MPKAYEAIRDKAIESGISKDAAQTKAAKIYNANKSKGIKGFSEKLSNKPEKGAQKKFEAMRAKQGAKPW